MRPRLKDGGDGTGEGVYHATTDFIVAGIPGILPGVEVQKLLPREKGHRWPKALIWGWPGSISIKARVEMPPLPRHPVYGPLARSEARRLLRDAKRAHVNFGWITKVSLLKVIHGERPLAFDVWKRAVLRLEEAISQRAAKRLSQPPQIHLKLAAGSRPTLGWGPR